MSQDKKLKFELPLSDLEIWLARIAIILIVVSFLIIGINYTQIPGTVPVHFNGAGKPDSWGHKAMLWILPVAMALVNFFITYISKKPAKFNYPYKITPENAENVYRKTRLSILLMAVVTALMTIYISWRSIQIAFGEATGLGMWFLPVFLIAMGAAFIPMLFPGKQDSSA